MPDRPNTTKRACAREVLMVPTGSATGGCIPEKVADTRLRVAASWLAPTNSFVGALLTLHQHAQSKFVRATLVGSTRAWLRLLGRSRQCYQLRSYSACVPIPARMFRVRFFFVYTYVIGPVREPGNRACPPTRVQLAQCTLCADEARVAARGTPFRGGCGCVRLQVARSYVP